MQAYQGYGQNKGTLVPGQAISVGKYNVQVDRYLSQGGFAHVYLCRTAQPVYNTTHHVLKRIAVQSEAMLTEVKKEVDIMRLLKGHPNIVHLIDAAWHALPNGVFEVFILMEFCPGGGIIDMMNRRLRERLTEAEILQIFVDVCEGVAYMHNSRPALLHRDLKVENILQSSPNSFKLCDFGSATTVAKTPTNMQEIRALEAELNKHTTLQYRAPEMVDPYLRRPVDEKSDVWALGVLLYKLCYYTTPFEEHGPLAILNVQYRTPPYPVYSSHMNGLIASMLREHGSHRPSVFELLNQVHTLRGTKSPFQYKVPVPQPLTPRHPPAQKQQPSQQPDQTGVPYRAGPQMAAAAASPMSPPKNNGVQAREKVLEAIAPMRRGRPGAAEQVPLKDSGSANKVEKPRNWLEDEEKAWKAATTHPKPSPSPVRKSDDAWGLKDSAKVSRPAKQDDGFGDDFAEKLWVEYDPNAQNFATTKPLVTPMRTANAALTPSKEHDAFAGLGLPSSSLEKPQTLGEARKFRTGGPSMNGLSPPETGNRTGPSPRSSPAPIGPSHQPSRSPQPQPTSRSPLPIKAVPSSEDPDAPAESRFPSLEELDQSFGDPVKPKPNPKPSGLSSGPNPNLHTSASTQALKRRSVHPDDSSEQLRPPVASKQSHSDGTRSQQVTGVAMRESRPHQSPVPPRQEPYRSADMDHGSTGSSGLTSRPSLTRKHRSSMNITSQMSSPAKDEPEKPTPRLPPRPPRDWLTGDDDTFSHAQTSTQPSVEAPKMRASPSKRASYIAHSNFQLPAALSVQHDMVTPSSSSSVDPPPTPSSTTSISRAARVFPDLGTDSSHPASSSSYKNGDDSSADEGPEDAHGAVPRSRKDKSSLPKRKGRQSSVHDLVDLWGGKSSIPASLDLEKGRSSMISAPQKSPSFASSNPQASTSVSTDRRTPTSAAISSAGSSRGRPQSMFVFPSKGTDPPNESASLEAQDVPKPRSARRTSISDMVLKYEHIVGRPKPAAAGPSPVTSSSPAPYRFTDEPVAKPPSESREMRKASMSISADQPKFGSPSKFSNPVAGLPRTSPGLPRASPAGLPRPSTNNDTARSQQNTEEVAVVRPRRISQHPSRPPEFIRQDSVASVTSTDTARSASPERPYKGVGKLIDQWQRKAADADPVAPPSPSKRVGIVGKRGGVVGASNGRGQ